MKDARIEQLDRRVTALLEEAARGVRTTSQVLQPERDEVARCARRRCTALPLLLTRALTRSLSRLVLLQGLDARRSPAVGHLAPQAPRGDDGPSKSSASDSAQLFIKTIDRRAFLQHQGYGIVDWSRSRSRPAEGFTAVDSPPTTSYALRRLSQDYQIPEHHFRLWVVSIQNQGAVRVIVAIDDDAKEQSECHHARRLDGHQANASPPRPTSRRRDPPASRP